MNNVIIPPDAIISKDKILRYLLWPRDEADKSGFLRVYGYTLANWNVLLEDIRRSIINVDASHSGTNPWGEIFKSRVDWSTPNGKLISVVMIWIRLTATGEFRFVTLYPDKENAE